MQSKGFLKRRLWVSPVIPDYLPVFLTIGGADPLEPQSLGLIQALKDNGVEQESVLFACTGAHLGAPMMVWDSRPARRTLQKALDFLERHSREAGDGDG